MNRARTDANTVSVTLTGTPRAVIALARALAAVTHITAMNHHVNGDQVIRIDATCHHPTRDGQT
jgi:hypothetical protein